MKIRKARKEDMKAVQDLRYNLSKYEKDIGLNIVVPEWGYTEVGERDYNYFFNKQFIFVAEEDEKIVGFITGEILSKKEWYKDIVKALRRKSKIEFFHRDDMAGENIDEIQFEKHL